MNVTQNETKDKWISSEKNNLLSLNTSFVYNDQDLVRKLIENSN